MAAQEASKRPPCNTLAAEHCYQAFRRHPRATDALELVKQVALVPLIPIRLFILLLAVCLYCACSGFAPPRVLRFFARIVSLALGFYKLQVRLCDKDGSLAKSAFVGVSGRSACEILGVKEKYGGVVSVHRSWCDIPLLLACMDVGFVARESVRHVPIVSKGCRDIGCVFVQRENGSGGNAARITKRLREAMEDDKVRPLAVFAEGTTSNGDGFLPFRSGAFVASVPLLPATIEFKWRKFNPCWETISFLSHLYGILTQVHNEAVITLYPVVENDKDASPKEAASALTEKVAAWTNWPVFNVGLAHKRVYHRWLSGECSADDFEHNVAAL
ncbi:MAG: hypothetical protein MHM6MM_005303 [Cercozoa sp. M6MM]